MEINIQIEMQSSTEATEGTNGELPVPPGPPEQTTATHDMTTGTRPKRRLDESERKLRLNFVGALNTTTS